MKNPILAFLFLLALALTIHWRSIHIAAATVPYLREIEQLVDEVQHGPILGTESHSVQAQQIVAELKQKLTHLLQLFDDLMMRNDEGNVPKLQQRLRKPTKAALRACAQLLKGKDSFGHKAGAELLDSLMARLRHTVMALPTELGTFLVEHEMTMAGREEKASGTSSSATTTLLTTAQLHCISHIELVLRRHPTAYCGFERFRRAKEQLLPLLPASDDVQLEGDDSMGQQHQQQQQRDVQQQAWDAFSVAMRLCIVETELRQKIAAFAADPSHIYGDAFIKLSQDIGWDLEEICLRAQKWPPNLAEKTGVFEEVDNLVRIARENAMPLKRQIEQKMDQIFGKTKQNVEALKHEFEAGKSGAKGATMPLLLLLDTMHGKMIQKTKQILQDLSSDMQIIGMPREDIHQTVEFLDREEAELRKNGHVEVFDEVIAIVGEKIEQEKGVISETYNFDQLLISTCKMPPPNQLS